MPRGREKDIPSMSELFYFAMSSLASFLIHLLQWCKCIQNIICEFCEGGTQLCSCGFHALVIKSRGRDILHIDEPGSCFENWPVGVGNMVAEVDGLRKRK